MDDQLEINKELELQITGAKNLNLWRLFGIQFILLPLYPWEDLLLVTHKQHFHLFIVSQSS
jgi:hypothetical protein